MPNARDRKLVFKNDEVTIYTEMIDALDTGKEKKRWNIQYTSGNHLWNSTCSTCVFSKEDAINHVILRTQKYIVEGHRMIACDPERHKKEWEHLLRNF